MNDWTEDNLITFMMICFILFFGGVGTLIYVNNNYEEKKLKSFCEYHDYDYEDLSHYLSTFHIDYNDFMRSKTVQKMYESHTPLGVRVEHRGKKVIHIPYVIDR